MNKMGLGVLKKRLLSVLLTSGRWAQIPTVYKQIDGYASDEITAKYAFIYAQLLQQNISQDSLT